MSALLVIAALVTGAVFPSAVGRMFTIDPEDRSSGTLVPLRIDAAASGAKTAEHPPP
jgi:hypothetical protein